MINVVNLNGEANVVALTLYNKELTFVTSADVLGELHLTSGPILTADTVQKLGLGLTE